MWRASIAALLLLCNQAIAEDFRSFEGHGGPVKAVRVSEDGRRMLTASFDYSVGIWDLTSEKEPLWLEGHRAAVNCVTFLSDDIAASGGDDFDVILWDLVARRPLRRLQGHKGKVMAVAATADGDRLASASWDGTIRIWDVATGDVLAELDDHDGNVNDVVWSDDGDRLYSAGYDGTVIEWDGRHYVPLRRLASHGFGVNVLALNDEAGWIAYGALDGGTRILDIETGREIADLTADRRPVLALALAAGWQQDRGGRRPWLHHGGRYRNLADLARFPRGVERADLGAGFHAVRKWRDRGRYCRRGVSMAARG